MSHHMPKTGRVRLSEHQPEASEASEPSDPFPVAHPRDVMESRTHRAPGNTQVSCNIKRFGAKCLT